MKIAVFYHCLFYHGTPPELRAGAFHIVNHQMRRLHDTGLEEAASEIVVGINGPVYESRAVGEVLLPEKAKFVMHGPDAFNENLTIREIEKWLPGHEDYLVFYFHAKGCTHTIGSPTWNMRGVWRECMSRHCLENWRQCVEDLNTFEAVGAHWMTGAKTPPGQSIFAGNFFWARASFLATLPSIMLRDRIKVSGIGAVESRYESEVWIGNGPRLPIVKDYHPDWDPSKIATCVL